MHGMLILMGTTGLGLGRPVRIGWLLLMIIPLVIYIRKKGISKIKTVSLVIAVFYTRV